MVFRQVNVCCFRLADGEYINVSVHLEES